MATEARAARGAVWRGLLHSSFPVVFVVWGVLMAMLRTTNWFWPLLGLSFISLGLNMTVRRHWRELHSWAISQSVRSGCAQPIEAVDFIAEVARGTIRSYRVRSVGELSEQWTVLGGAALQAHRRDADVEIMLMLDVSAASRGQFVQLLFPPLLVLQRDGDCVEISVDQKITLGREMSGGPDEAIGVPVHDAA